MKSFKIGDKVAVIDTNQKGEVIEISGLKATIVDEDGFDFTFLISKLTHQFSAHTLEDTIKVEKIISEKEETTKPGISKKNIARGELVVDLHIHVLVDKFAHLTNFEMLQIQLDKVKNTLAKVNKHKTQKVIFIHGKGTGKLKQELETYLKSKSYNFYPARLLEFGTGATTVEI